MYNGVERYKGGRALSGVIHLNESSFSEDLLRNSERLLINFWAEWCGPCKFVNHILEELAQEEDLTICLVNVDRNPKLMQRFRIETIPNVLLYSHGKLIEQVKKLDKLMIKEEIRKKILS